MRKIPWIAVKQSAHVVVVAGLYSPRSVGFHDPIDGIGVWLPEGNRVDSADFTSSGLCDAATLGGTKATFTHYAKLDDVCFLETIKAGIAPCLCAL